MGMTGSALEAQIKRLGIEQRVLMPGYVTNAGGRFLPLFQIFALSSLTEGLPIVILEAMQAGVPIVATRVGGVPDVLENGKSGVLVDARSSKKLVEGIRILMSDNISARRMADIAMDLVKTKYSTELMGQKYNEIYEDLLRIH